MLKREFHCPMCHGRTFGGLPDRMCNGFIITPLLDGSGNLKSRRCTFKWNVEDDWKYMQLVVTAEDASDTIDDVITKAYISHVQTRPMPSEVSK
jgi:hypothetical protein